MSVLAFPDPRRSREEASLWLARLDRGLSDDERSGLRDWLRDAMNNRAFLLRTATAIAMNRFSRNGPRPNGHAEDLTVPEVQQLSSESHEAENDASQRFVAFCRAVGGLPEECRRVMILKKVYGLSLGEIADHLGTTRALVEKDLARGLMMCRDYLDSASRPGSGGGDPPDVRRTGQK